MTQVLIVGVGGMIGSILRFWLAGAVQRGLPGAFPAGTLAVNLLGCAAIGAFAGIAETRDWLSPEIRLFVMVGILGGFTTFSAFGLETFHLLRDEAYLLALANVLASVLVGTAAVATGWAAVKFFTT